MSSSSLASTTPVRTPPISPFKRRHSYSFARKERTVKLVDSENDPEKKRLLLGRLNKSMSDICKMRGFIAQRNLTPKSARINKKRERSVGGGRLTRLSDEQEKELETWIIQQRRQGLKVTEEEVQDHAKVMYALDGFVASDSWIQGFMKRKSSSMRTRTTVKDLDDAVLNDTTEHYRVNSNEISVTCLLFAQFIDPPAWNQVTQLQSFPCIPVFAVLSRQYLFNFRRCDSGTVYRY